MTALLDTHVIHWWSTQPEKLSKTAATAIQDAEELTIADISWYELALLAYRKRIILGKSITGWFADLADALRTIGVTPNIATTAASLSDPFPRDPADRLIYATAVEHGFQLITKDERLLRQPGTIAIW